MALRELPTQRHRDRARDAGDRPAAAKEVEPPARSRGAVHDHRERDEGGRRGQRRQRPDREHHRDCLLAREYRRDQGQHRIARPRDQSEAAVPRDHVASGLEPPPERDCEQEGRQSRERGEQAYVARRSAEAEQEHRQERPRRADDADEDGVDLDQSVVASPNRRERGGLPRGEPSGGLPSGGLPSHARNATAWQACRVPYRR